MKLYRYLNGTFPPLALAIGNFDGVHLGHQAILETCRVASQSAASSLGLQPSSMTFSPLPREYFAKRRNDPKQAPARLMSVTEKLAAMKIAGMAHVFVPRFDAKFAGQSPEAFMAKLLALNVKWLMVGEDFRFGAKRVGNVTMLRDYGAEHGFMVETMADVSTSAGEKISSTAIRTALAAGDLNTAERMLGRKYSITGRITHGKKLGRTLGFPTANVSLSGRKPAVSGVFAVEFRLVSRGLEGVVRTNADVSNAILGVANLGTNPVVSIDNRHHLEVFLFDFPNKNSGGNLYGKRVQVTFIEKIRDELNFTSADPLKELVKQMHDDCARAKTILRKK